MASRTRMLCEGAMMCALTALLLLINRVAGGMIETAFPWLLVFPLLVYCARYGVRAALICCVSILLLSLMLCTFTTLFYVFSASLCALAYGSGVRRDAANRSLLLRTGLISFLSNLLSMVVLASLFGYDPAEEAKLLIELLHADPSMVMRSALVLAVFTVVVCSLLQTLCIHFGALLLLGRIGIPTHPVKAAHEISGPRWLGVTILMIWVLYSWGIVIKLDTGSRLLQLGVLTACLCAAVYGALTLMCAFISRGHPRGMLAAYVLLFVPVVNLFLALLGEADLLFQLRGRMMRGVKNGTSGKL